MKCKCMHCQTEYENNRDYKTSICDECFKRFNENQLQLLKDRVQKLAFENSSIRTKLFALENQILKHKNVELFCECGKSLELSAKGCNLIEFSCKCGKYYFLSEQGQK